MLFCFVSRMKENYRLLTNRLHEIKESKKRLEVDLKQQADKNRTLVAEMNALKPDIKRYYRSREQNKK
jgi:phosphoinositide-3-kinase regulatory subunit